MAPLAERKDIADAVDRIDWRAEQYRLSLAIDPVYRQTLVAMHALVADALGLDPRTFRLDDAATRRVLEHAAEQTIKITETTRGAIDEQLTIGQERGYSTWQIINGVPKEDYLGIEGLYSGKWKTRPDTIARTILGDAQRISAIDRYKASGLVDRVAIRDGEEDEPCKSRNGTTVPLDEAPELAHPRCTLVLIPVLREGV
jgi:hypothetical protein